MRPLQAPRASSPRAPSASPIELGHERRPQPGADRRAARDPGGEQVTPVDLELHVAQVREPAQRLSSGPERPRERDRLDPGAVDGGRDLGRPLSSCERGGKRPRSGRGRNDRVALRAPRTPTGRAVRRARARSTSTAAAASTTVAGLPSAGSSARARRASSGSASPNPGASAASMPSSRSAPSADTGSGSLLSRRNSAPIRGPVTVSSAPSRIAASASRRVFGSAAKPSRPAYSASRSSRVGSSMKL